jgi:hypothetical protein
MAVPLSQRSVVVLAAQQQLGNLVGIDLDALRDLAYDVCAKYDGLHAWHELL